MTPHSVCCLYRMGRALINARPCNVVVRAIKDPVRRVLGLFLCLRAPTLLLHSLQRQQPLCWACGVSASGTEQAALSRAVKSSKAQCLTLNPLPLAQMVTTPDVHSNRRLAHKPSLGRAPSTAVDNELTVDCSVCSDVPPASTLLSTPQHCDARISERNNAVVALAGDINTGRHVQHAFANPLCPSA